MSIGASTVKDRPREGAARSTGFSVKATIGKANAPKETEATGMSDHPLLRVRESTCDTWGQGTHICDSDALPKLEYLQWNRGERSRISGEWVPTGRECTVCEKVRKRQWPKGTAQSGFVVQCTNGDTDFRSKALRTDRVSGDMKPANDGDVGATQQSVDCLLFTAAALVERSSYLLRGCPIVKEEQ